jgi:hypothetical protein
MLIAGLSRSPRARTSSQLRSRWSKQGARLLRPRRLPPDSRRNLRSFWPSAARIAARGGPPPPEDMKVEAKNPRYARSCHRLRDKVLLVLSGASVASGWLEDEVTKAFAEERQRGEVVLLPVRLDDAAFATKQAWALKLRDTATPATSVAGRTVSPISARSNGYCATCALRDVRQISRLYVGAPRARQTGQSASDLSRPHVPMRPHSVQKRVQLVTRRPERMMQQGTQGACARDVSRCSPHHLGVATVCGMPPGVSSVLVPLPLFSRKPSPPLPGIVVVCNVPRLPVTTAGPRDVRNDWPGIDACTLVNAGPPTRAQAVPPRPISNAIAMTAIDGLCTTEAADLRDPVIFLSFPECEQRLRHHARTICSGRRAGLQSRLPPARHIVLHRPVCDAGSAHGHMYEQNGRSRLAQRVSTSTSSRASLLGPSITTARVSPSR